MTNSQKVTLYASLAGIFAVTSSIFSAQQSISHIFIVLPLVLMGIFLFAAGYYAGMVKAKREKL